MINFYTWDANFWKRFREKRKMPGRFAEGPRHPGFIPARLRSERARKPERLYINRKLDKNGQQTSEKCANLALFVAAQKLVAFDGRDYSYVLLVARFGALYAAEAADADRSG